MIEQEIRLKIPNKEVYDKLHKTYYSFLKKAAIFDTDYYDTRDLQLLDKGILLRKRIIEGKIFIQAKKIVKAISEGVIQTETKEEMQKNIEDSKIYHFLLNENGIEKVEKILTLHSKRNYYYVNGIEFLLDDAEYEDYLRNTKGEVFELRLEILAKTPEIDKFVKKMQSEYGLILLSANKLQRILLGMGD
ncbi:MAG: CYTH domain-containing protein [Patescibacteria group bacterium]|nr:CYTH domain-containing protein [Patescibacteria group bacterium]